MERNTDSQLGGRPVVVMGTVMLVLVLAAGMMVLPIAGGVATADDGPPEVPAAYYGSVTIDGEPAPEDTIITAVVDGEERDTLVTDELGQYGGPSVDDDKLEVPGTTGDGEVTFLVNGVEAETDPSNVEWESGDIEEVDLEVGDIGEAFIDVEIDTDASNLSVDPNETATVVADLENTGEVKGVSDATFELDGETLATEDQQVFEAGETETLEYSVELADEGEFEAVISTTDASDAVIIGVGEDDPPSVPPAPPDDEPANITVTEADLSATTIDENKSVDVTADIENTGEEAGEVGVSLEVDGEVIDSQKVSVGATSSETVTFTETFTDPGEYNISINGLEAGTLTVVEDEVTPADIEVVDANVETPEIEAGEEVSVDASLENTGEAEGIHTATLTINDEVVAEEDVEVRPGETATVTLSGAVDDSGTHDVFIDNVEAGTVTVTDDVDDDVPEDDTDDVDDDGIPGFGALVALAAILGASIVFMRRR